MKILFICKHNRFRSKVAEAIFKKLNKKDKIKTESAGIFMDEQRYYIADNVIKIMQEKGYSIKGKPRRIISSDINSYDIIAIVANNINKRFFTSLGFKGKIIKWNIPDADEIEFGKIKKIINDIENRVKNLLKIIEKLKQ